MRNMEHNSQKLINLANKRFGDVLRDGFRLFFQTYKTMILPLALFQILLIVLNVFLLTDLNWYINSLGLNLTEIMDEFIESTNITPEEMNRLVTYLILSFASTFLQNLIGAIVIAIAMCSVSSYVYKKYMNEDVSFKDSFKSAFNKKIFLVILILGFCLPLAGQIFFLYVPGIIIFYFFIFSVFTYNMEVDKNPLSEARAIAKRNFWKIIGVFLINIVVIVSINFIYSLAINISMTAFSPELGTIYNSWLNPSTRNYGMLILYNILISVVDIIFAPLFICLLTALFSSLKAKKDLGYQYQRDTYPKREMYQESYRILRQEPYRGIETEETTTQPEMGGESRFYCPYCGTLIKTPKRFCPKCGENLENLI